MHECGAGDDDELELDDYPLTSAVCLVSRNGMDAVLGSVDGSVRFYGLTPNQYETGGTGSTLAPD